MRYGYLIFILMLMCGIIALSACKPEQDGTGTSEATPAEVPPDTTQEVSPQIQLTLEQLEQYGGAAGMIESIESYIGEHGIVYDIGELRVLKPLVELYFEYTEEELVGYFGVSQSEIVQITAKVAGSISDWEVNAGSIAELLTLGDGGEKTTALYYKLYEAMDEKNADTLNLSIINQTRLYEDFENLLRSAQTNYMQYDGRPITITDTLPEYSPGKSESDISGICGQVRVTFNNYIYDNVPLEIDSGILSWKGVRIGQILHSAKAMYTPAVTPEWLDICFNGGDHGEVKEYSAKTMYNYSSNEYNEEGGTKGVTLYYSKTFDGMYEDWVILHPDGIYLTLRFNIIPSLSPPSPSEIIEGLEAYWIIFPNIEELEVTPYDGIVTDAYRLNRTINYQYLPELSYRSMLYIPRINNSCAAGVNAKIKRDILAFNAPLLPNILDGSASEKGGFVDTTYMYTVRDSMVCVTVCFIKGKLASDDWTVRYKCYYFDESQDREITPQEYITRLGVDINYVLGQINNEANYKMYVEYYYSGKGAWYVTQDDIAYLCALEDGTYDIYTNADKTDNMCSFFFTVPFNSHGKWHVFNARGGFKQYYNISFVDTTKEEYDWITFDRPSTREYSLSWLDDNTVAVKYWTGEDYSSFFIADLTSKKADCDFDITPEQLLGLCGVSRTFSPDGKSTLDIAFARVSGAGADRTIIASFTAAYEDLSGALKVTGELSMKLDGTGLKVTNIKMGT